MVLSMPSPSQHPKTGVYQFRQRIPASIGSLAAGKRVSITIDGKLSRPKIGKELKVSLGTKDPRRAKELAKEAQDQFDLIWASFANAPVRLSLRQCVALSGDVYRVFRAALEDERDRPDSGRLTGRFENRGGHTARANDGTHDHREWYRYHHLFADVLLTQLDDEARGEPASPPLPGTR